MTFEETKKQLAEFGVEYVEDDKSETHWVWCEARFKDGGTISHPYARGDEDGAKEARRMVCEIALVFEV